MQAKDLPLAEAISRLRDELGVAVDRAVGADIRFAVESVEVELQVVANNATEGGASAGLWQVVTVGGKASHATAATHKVRLVLRPKADLETGDDEVLVGETAETRPE